MNESQEDCPRRWYDLPAYLVVRVFICLVQALPMSTCHAWSRRLAWLFGSVLRVREQTVQNNLRAAFPELDEQARARLTLEMWEHLFLLVCEVAHAPRKIHDTNWRDYVRLHDSADLVRSLLSDRPTVIVSGHYGNFELSGVLLGILGFPSYTIARRLDNRFLDRFVNDFRGSKGQHILSKDGSARQIDALLASGGTLAFLADQHAGRRGCQVNFFGRPVLAHKAIALFSLCNDAPMVVRYARRQGQPLQQVVGIEAVADPRAADSSLGSMKALTQWYTAQIENVIRVDPAQYWWLHRRWRALALATTPVAAAEVAKPVAASASASREAAA